jgi:hypothetical protein
LSERVAGGVLRLVQRVVRVLGYGHLEAGDQECVMGSREPLLDPTGESNAALDVHLAPRLSSLSGLRIGLLNNGKPNGEALLHEVARQLQDGYGCGEATLYTKGYFGTPADEDLILRMLKNSDFAVAGIGD